MQKSIKIDGIRFTLCEGRKYHYNTTLRKHLHQYVWEKENGIQPKGYEIHHIDFDTFNSSIDNLKLMKASEHRKLHSDNWTEDRLERSRKNLQDKARPKACEWHGSDEGRVWHKEHYDRYGHLLHQKRTFKCDMCGVTFEAINNGSNKFCSNACKSKWRRLSGLDDVDKVCENCGKTFTTNKYSKKKCCDKSCAAQYRHKIRKLKDSPNLQELNCKK